MFPRGRCGNSRFHVVILKEKGGKSGFLGEKVAGSILGVFRRGSKKGHFRAFLGGGPGDPRGEFQGGVGSNYHFLSRFLSKLHRKIHF